MNKVKILIIVFAIASVALVPSLMSNQPADATGGHTGWCNQQPKSEQWVEACVQGWYDHDHCKKYDPSKVFSKTGYKVGWDRGHCR